jgi:hypothetical protein
MSGGQILTAATIWIAIIAYGTGSAIFALSENRPRWHSLARLVWTIACLALLAHIASAFHFFHQWSHDAAYRDTARQTEEMFGFNSGVGIYFNYALLTLWILDVCWWWIKGLEAYRRRPWLLVAAWHTFLIFMFFNATVVFGRGLVRWLGLCVCLALLVVWWLAWRSRRNNKAQIQLGGATGKPCG